MGGLLTHLAIGGIAAIIVHLLHYKLEFSLSIFVGNLLPDTIKFGLTALKQLTWKIFYVEKDAFYHKLAVETASYANWFAVGFFVIVSAWLLYHYHVIKKKKMFEYDELYVFLLAGVILHLMTDSLVIENGPWL